MRTVTDPAALQQQMLALRAQGKSIGFVPTMGFLHRGHASLFDVARPRCDVLVASIYVNPLQFGPGEDLDRYPRDPTGDARTCAAHGVDVLFIPETLYPPGHQTRVGVPGLSTGLCGKDRPAHFEGVATVVARLFGLVQPTVAVFGEKDFQQLAILRRMVTDLALPISIIGGPLVRDDDGVALSSRNAYLSPDERRRARTLSQALFSVQTAVARGEQDAAKLLSAARVYLDCDALDYLEIRDAETLTAIDTVDRPARVFGAARYRGTRLIDNVALEP